ncbi:MAG TPA: DivIVA domain-containing protein [Acidimicrobiia bacterium]|nr:DivIVA domain-containing protein [Acidimicrobiia bacterium]
MDVTPRELRDTDIREGFRGYHRDDVDELLERAASTVEGLSERVRQLTERLQSVEGSAGKSRETEEMLQRTLVLAQKTADEAISEAQERSRTLLEESETKARKLVTEAEGTARRVAENERSRLESEVQDLSSRRDALNADVEALEKYEREYRTRLRKAIETELDSLGKFSAQHGQRPKLHDVSVPPPREAVANSGRQSAPAPPANPSSAASSPSTPTAEIGSVGPFPKAPPEPARGAPPADPDPGWGDSDAPPSEPVSKPTVGSTPGLADFVPADEPVEPEVLDDDAFFATLREAVRDDAPLGPRDDEEDDDLFDDETAPRKRGWGRRR